MHLKKRYVFVCTNERPPDHEKGSCARCGAGEVYAKFKELVEKKELEEKARVLQTSCLDVCDSKASVCVMPDNVWYGGVRVEDAEEIVDSHLVRGHPVARLLIPEVPAGESIG